MNVLKKKTKCGVRCWGCLVAQEIVSAVHHEIAVDNTNKLNLNQNENNKQWN